MHIYLIINKINGKKYVGQTKRKDPLVRWKSHIYNAKTSNDSNMAITRAIKKHGAENFEFKVIESNPNWTPHELSERESYYIVKLNTFISNGSGYNMIYCCEGQGEWSEESKERMGRSLHKSRSKKRDGISGYIGVQVCFRARQKTPTYSAFIKFKGVHYCRSFKDPIEAAVARDKLAVYFYEDDAVKNFPEKEYSQNELEECYRFFLEEQQKGVSAYKGVIKNTNESSFYPWIAQHMSLRRLCKSEDEAAKEHDMLLFYKKGLDNVPTRLLNFPNAIPSKKEFKKWKDEFEDPKSRKLGNKSKFLGVWFRDYGWVVKDKDGRQYYSGDNEEEAAKMSDLLRVVKYNDSSKLNFGEPTESEIKEFKALMKSIDDREHLSSKYLGVSFCNTHSVWSAVFKGKKIGTFKNEEDAARAREMFIYKKLGANAPRKYLNFKEEFPSEEDISRFNPLDKKIMRKKSSNYEGVSFAGDKKISKKWYSRYNGKFLGYFHTEQEAFEAREKFIKEKEKYEK